MSKAIPTDDITNQESDYLPVLLGSLLLFYCYNTLSPFAFGALFAATTLLLLLQYALAYWLNRPGIAFKENSFYMVLCLVIMIAAYSAHLRESDQECYSEGLYIFNKALLTHNFPDKGAAFSNMDDSRTIGAQLLLDFERKILKHKSKYSEQLKDMDNQMDKAVSEIGNYYNPTSLIKEHGVSSLQRLAHEFTRLAQEKRDLVANHFVFFERTLDSELTRYNLNTPKVKLTLFYALGQERDLFDLYLRYRVKYGQAISRLADFIELVNSQGGAEVQNNLFIFSYNIDLKKYRELHSKYEQVARIAANIVTKVNYVESTEFANLDFPSKLEYYKQLGEFLKRNDA